LQKATARIEQLEATQPLNEEAVELAVTRALERTPEATRATVAQINIETVLRAAGYRSLHSPHGKIWVPKSYPLKQVSGFIPPADEED
jgi:hypothetical protein